MSNFYVVATPIGNLADITLRALEVLKSCEIIFCEDSRITLRLLQKYDIKNKKLLVYNDNSNHEDRQKILNYLQNGKDIAFVSDAGTPLISDPGYKLIEFLQEQNCKIVPIPGASSLTAALCVSGVAIDNFLFLGFLPNSTLQRKNILQNLPKNFTFTIFENANRVIDVLQEILEVLGNRKIAIVREITKIHEEIIKNDTKNLLQFFEKNQEKLRGEFVIIVEKQDKNTQNISDEDLKKEIKKLLRKGLSVKDVSEELAEVYDINKKTIYKLAIANF
ncbi:MAG TPA: 16S rRNA (cytidine(1402)-2'-O)-methyltransferase [Rickettsiales bacterium]|nr:16S rRNA (cytidine(1402)-2'-O)-methyltransferase [Rickettsiales bacterium]